MAVRRLLARFKIPSRRLEAGQAAAGAGLVAVGVAVLAGWPWALVFVGGCLIFSGLFL